MKVRGSSFPRTGPTETGPKGEKKARPARVGGIEGIEAKKTSFIEELRETSDLKTKEILDEVLGSIDEAAREFLEHTTYENLLIYKGLVQRFMKVAIERLYKVKERLSSKATDRQKIYTIIEEVDKKLKLLTEEILSKQNDPLSLIAKMDEIRGMLVDIYS
jgi:hypothetical protein